MGPVDQLGPSRRRFLRTASAAGTALAGLTGLGATPKGAGKALKVGLIGCGGRGGAALDQHLQAARVLNRELGAGIRLQVAATADWFQDKALRQGKRHGVPKAQCFGGPKAYQKLLDAGVDIVLICSPPAFHPGHLEAAVAAGKHVFLEKPAGVDPPGCRRVIAAGEAAMKKGLTVVAGTQRRHYKPYIDTQAAVAEGQLGKIVLGRIAWCQRHQGSIAKPKSLDLDTLIRTWRDWHALSGDHIVEQHIHNIDVANWFIGAPPVAAVGVGGKMWRPSGDRYDFFSVDFEYPGNVHVHSMCRQIDDTEVWVGEWLLGDKLVVPKPRPGQAEGSGPQRPLRRLKSITECRGGALPKTRAVPQAIPQDRRAHLQEHINLLYYLLVEGKPLNQAADLATSTAAAILGRTAAYTGKRVTWKQLMADRDSPLYSLALAPTAADLEAGTAVLPKPGAIPRPGKSA